MHCVVGVFDDVEYDDWVERFIEGELGMFWDLGEDGG